MRKQPDKFETLVKEFMVHIRADMTSLSHRIDNVGENLGILQNLTVSPVNEVSLLGRIIKMEGQIIANGRLDARVATIELAHQKMQDIQCWMDDHYTKWHEIQEYKDEVNKLKIHFETWNAQILKLQELTIIHEDPKSLINRLDNVESHVKDLMAGLGFTGYETLKKLGDRITEVENMPRLIGSKMLERVDRLDVFLDNQLPVNANLTQRLERVEKRIKDFDGSNRSKPNWATVNQIEATIRNILDKQDEHDSDIRAINGEFIRMYRNVPDENEPHQPTTSTARPGTTEALQLRIEKLEQEKARWESLEWKFLAIEKRMEETLKIANPMTCDRCGKVFSPQAIKQTDEENVCMMCRLDVIEVMTIKRPDLQWEMKDDGPRPDPNDPLPGEEKYDYATRISKLAMKRWDELYGKK